MAPNSSTSNSKRLLRGSVILWCAGIVTSIWLLYGLLGARVASHLAEQYGSQLKELSRGRVLNPAPFLQVRFFELALLISVATVLVILGHLVWKVLEKRISANWLWVPVSLFVFAEVNVWAAVAAQTGTLWLILFAGYPNLTQSSFHTERIVTYQSPNPMKVYAIGSSQAQSEIHAGELNRAFAGEIAFGNIGVSGATAYDFLMLQDHYLKTPPDVVVCYLSELNFYETCSGRLCLSYLTFSGLRETLKLDGVLKYVGDGVPHGVVGATLPLYRMRRAVESFLFGGMAEFSPNVMIPIRRPTPDKKPTAISTEPKPKEISEAAPPPGARQFFLEQDALSSEMLSEIYELGEESKLNQQAFERFVERNSAHGIQTVIIFGQLNPDYAKYLDPAIHADLVKYIEALKQKYPDLLILQEELPAHPAEEYDDYWHINPQVRLSFTQELGRVLADKLNWPQPQSAP